MGIRVRLISLETKNAAITDTANIRYNQNLYLGGFNNFFTFMFF